MTRRSTWLASFSAGILTAVSVPAMGEITAQKLIDLPGGDFSTQMYTSIQRAPGRPNDLFVSRADGKIYRVDLTTNTQSLFYQLPTTDYNAGGGYYGLLGFTFAPDFATSGKLYVHVAGDLGGAGIRSTTWGGTNTNAARHRIYIREYTLNNPLSGSPTLASS